MIVRFTMGDALRPPLEKGRPAREASRVGIKSTSRFNRTEFKTLRAGKLRRDQTEVEKRLWEKLRARQLGVDFRRQHPVGDFVLDFYAPALRLAIELDGRQHSEPAAMKDDEKRTRWLADRGVTMLRFWNSDVIQNMSGVLEMASSKISELDVAGMTPTRRWRADLSISGGGNRPKGAA